MDQSVIPGTTVEYPNPEYQGYSSPPDGLVINVAYLVDPKFRNAVKEHLPVKATPKEIFYADMARERLGISFGTAYQFPPGMNARSFQLAFLKCVSPANVYDKTVTAAERRNLDQTFAVLKELNPEEFRKLSKTDLSEKEKFDVIMGVCSKFTMADINYFIQKNRLQQEGESIPGVQFFMCPETKTKLNDFLEKNDTSLAYLNEFGFVREWQDISDQNLKMEALLEHQNGVIIEEIRKNPDRFFAALRGSHIPGYYADQILRRYRPKEILEADKAIGARLYQIKEAGRAPRQDGKDTLIRQGLSKILELTQKLPPSRRRKSLRESIAKGYRYFYPKDADRS